MKSTNTKTPRIQDGRIDGPKTSLSHNALRWLEQILYERFGHPLELGLIGATLRLSLPGAAGCVIFDTLNRAFLTHGCDMPCSHWDATAEGWQPIFDEPLPMPGVTYVPTPVIERTNDTHLIHYDILGLTYWMLARVEEIGRTDLDEHERFPAKSSHAYKHGYLDRPIVDEWLIVLGQVIERQWLGIELKRHRGSIFVTCDVDSPFAFNGSIKQYVRRLGGDVLRRCSPRAVMQTLRRAKHWRQRYHPSDPHYQNILWMMDECEKNGHRAAFYFLAGGASRFDGSYRLHEPAIRSLLKTIHERGHEIGLHPSYMTFNDSNRMTAEATELRNTLDTLGIPSDSIGGRQHYLRWQTPRTARNWSEVGMVYDSTLSYADHAGFRCGTSHEYPLFDAVAQVELKTRERPLIAMDCSVIEKRYMGMGFGNDSLRYMSMLQQHAISTGGSFTLLWHNSYFEHVKSEQYFLQIITQTTRKLAKHNAQLASLDK